ncbi:hypothetical protein KEM56_006074 [Ascosphaera pollenicola]|nr:hypothetical protein KEM56_006074 [Ascosphaera pollenicola]
MNKILRSNTASSLQKTYDETYILCSTAIYFEGQNNEEEALRSWRIAQDRINYLNAHRMPSNYQPKNQSERNVYESLRRLEQQCQERIDILESLKQSRNLAFYAPLPPATANVNFQRGSVASYPTTVASGAVNPGKVQRPDEPPFLPPRNGYVNTFGPTPMNQPPGPYAFAGGGVLAPMNYCDLAKPNSRPLPHNRLSPRKSSESQRTVDSSGLSMRSNGESSESVSYNDPRPFLSTLRSPTEPRQHAPPKEDPRKATRPVAASRAAGLAWNSISTKLANANKRQGNIPELSKLRSNERRDSNELRHLSADHVRHARAPYLSDFVVNSSNKGNGHNQSHTSATEAALAATTSRRRSPNNYRRRQKTPEPLIDFSSNFSPNKSPHSSSANPSPDGQRLSAVDITSRPSQSPLGRQGVPSRRPPKPRHLQGRPAYSPARPHREAAHQTAQGHRTAILADDDASREDSRTWDSPLHEDRASEFKKKCDDVLKHLPSGIDPAAAKQILTDIVIHGDEVHWDDVAGLEVAKMALKEAVVYPFLRPDLFSGLREPARGMLLFGPPGTGKTMLARAVATESQSTFFSVGASSLTSKWHGESEKLVKALFGLAKVFAPSIIFVDEIDAILSARSSQGEHEVSRRTKTEFLVQWSDLQKAAAGREPSESMVGDASRVLVLAATNIPWDIDEAARRRFVRRQYIPLPEAHVRKMQLERLLGHQKHDLTAEQLERLVELTDGFSGSDMTALAKDAAMGPLRNLGEALLHTPMDQIRPISFEDFEASLLSIRPSVSQSGLQAYEDWARSFGERGG